MRAEGDCKAASGGQRGERQRKVLAAERTSQAHLVEARTKAEVQRIEAATKAEATTLAVQAELRALEERSKLAVAHQTHPALLRLEELATLRELGQNANARIYLDFKERPAGENGADRR